MKKKLLLSALLLSALLLAACGKGTETPAPLAPFVQKAEPVTIDGAEYDPKTTTEITAVVTNETVALLDQLPGLVSADLSGSECLAAIRDWAAAHPSVHVR